MLIIFITDSILLLTNMSNSKLQQIINIMSIYLSYLNKPQFTQQLIQQPSFMAKNKISVNNPVQTHYTVEGVQSYAPDQIKAIKQRQEKLMQGKDGTWAPLKVVLLSDQIIQFQGNDPLKQTKLKDNKKQKAKQKPVRVQSANRQRVKTNARNAVSANNQALVKLEKEVTKRNSLQRKLQKMSQKYKQYFKDVDLKQGLKANKKIGQSANVEEQQEEQHTEKIQQKDQQDQKLSQSIMKSEQKLQKTTYNRSSKPTKPKQFKQSNKQIEQQQSQNNEQDQSKNLSFEEEVNNTRPSTCYSEKLGTAIHELFK